MSFAVDGYRCVTLGISRFKANVNETGQKSVSLLAIFPGRVEIERSSWCHPALATGDYSFFVLPSVLNK